MGWNPVIEAYSTLQLRINQTLKNGTSYLDFLLEQEQANFNCVVVRAITTKLEIVHVSVNGYIICDI